MENRAWREVGDVVRGEWAEPEWEAHVSQAMRSVLSRDRDLVLCGEAGLGGLLKVELLEAVECRGESESWRRSHMASLQHVARTT